MTDPTGAERVLVRLRPHGRTLTLPAVAAVLLSAVTGFGLGVAPEDWQRSLVAAVGAALLVLTGLLPSLRWAATRYVVTDRRVVVRRGLVVRTRQEVLHGRGYGVTVRRSALQAAFRSGDVLLVAGGDPPVVLTDVPTVRLVQATLQDLVERAAQDDAAARRAWPSPFG
ncbi:PH domain-containing protein [Frigoribacterium salinisoli]